MEVLDMDVESVSNVNSNYSAAETVKVTNAQGESQACRQRWEKGSRILHLSFENHPDGIRVELSW